MSAIALLIEMKPLRVYREMDQDNNYAIGAVPS
jgi:hypothetical protein